MPFDACMLHCITNEINNVAGSGRIEKIYQPERDEIILQMRTREGGKRLLINAGSNNPRISFTTAQKENPMQAPMFCMLLRKHLTGALLSSVEQEGFERVVRLTFETRDELGFECKKHLIAEVMGKYSNLIFADENLKVIAALKTGDFTTSSLRQVLPGMRYELPPAQNKKNPLITSREEFLSLVNDVEGGIRADKFITSYYMGISTAVAREIVNQTTGEFDTSLSACDPDSLYESFDSLFNIIKSGDVTPSVIYDNGFPVEFSFIDLLHYGRDVEYKHYDSLSEALDSFYQDRDKEQRIKQRASDIMKMLTSAEARLIKKIDSQEKELADCARGEEYKKKGDLITSNIYLLKRGDKAVELIDYESWNEETSDFNKTIIELDERLTPAANAQRYFKLYNKSKNAKVELTKQIDIAKKELEYIYSVFDALAKSETAMDLTEIRDELYRSGYASKMKGYAASKKAHKPTPTEFISTNGYRILCGKNNYQNEYITHQVAEKSDYWFHAKNVAGSHVILITNGEEPPAEDFTDACEIAAYHSKAQAGQQVEVDYLFCKGVKKVPGAKPGFVVYHNNWSAYVTPTEEKIKKMRVKK